MYNPCVENYAIFHGKYCAICIGEIVQYHSALFSYTSFISLTKTGRLALDVIRGARWKYLCEFVSSASINNARRDECYPDKAKCRGISQSVLVKMSAESTARFSDEPSASIAFGPLLFPSASDLKVRAANTLLHFIQDDTLTLNP